MSHRLSFLALLCAPLAAGCIQAFDANVSGGALPINSTADASKSPRREGGVGSPPEGGNVSGQDSAVVSMPDGGRGSSGQDGGEGSAGEGGGGLPVCQNGNIVDPNTNPVFCVDDEPSGQRIVTQTPGIQLPDGATTINPCDLTTYQSWVIRQKYCAACHEGNNNPMAPFHNIIDDADGGLFRTLSITTKDDAGNFVPLIIPGDPENSYLYKRVMTGSMPPDPASVAITPPPKPNVSEIGIIYSWIANCVVAPTATDAGSPADAGGGG